MERIRVTTVAWNDLEKLKGQKSKRKKQAGNNFFNATLCSESVVNHLDVL